MNIKSMVGGVIGLVVAGIVLSNVFPIAMDALNASDTSNWTAAAQSIWTILPIFFILIPLVILVAYLYRRV